MDLATISTPRLQDQILQHSNQLNYLYDAPPPRRNQMLIRGTQGLLNKAQGELDRRGAAEAVA